MQTIIADNIAAAHEAVVKLIMDGHEDVNDLTTEDNELTFEYPTPVNIHINHPNIPPFYSPALRFGARSLDEYAKQVLNPRMLVDKEGKPDFSYLYSDLIFDYPEGTPFKIYSNNHSVLRVDWPYGNGRGDGTNQIEHVIRKLKENPATRRAVVSLFEPNGHNEIVEPPCLQHIMFMVRNGKLNMHALFRSNDALSAWGSNSYALMRLQEMVVNRLEGVEWGWMETTSLSAHVYFKRDSEELKRFKALWH